LFICIFISAAVNQGSLIFIYYCTVLRVLYLRRRCVGRADQKTDRYNYCVVLIVISLAL